MRVAETLRATLIEVVLRLADEATAERKEANYRQELLIAELNHRVRNILSLIRGLIRQSKPASGTTVEDFVAQIDGRIHALARAHNQITDDHWGPAPVRNLLEAESAAFLSEQRDRLLLKGPNVLLNPQAYSTLALVVHELVTNSVKYGSLSGPAGETLVNWSIREDGGLDFNWREQGGPEVWPPNRKGFGTTITEQSIPCDLGGTAKIEYAREGLRADFVIPEKFVVQARGTTAGKIDLPIAAHAPAQKVGELLRGKRVLLVEDSLIIALDVEDILQRLGAEFVVTEGNAAGAIAAVETERPDIAILDINLGDHDSVSIANRLLDLDILFMFATGYGEQSALPDRLKSRPVLQKPYTLASLSRALSALIDSR